MIRFIYTVLLYGITGTLLWFFCALPLNPAENPKNATVSLFLADNNNTVQQGNHKQVGMRLAYPQHIESYHVASTCGNFDTTIQPALLKTEDTLYFNPQFQNEGTCTLWVTAKYFDNSFKDKCDSLILVVLPGEPTLDFSVTPVAFTTHTGTADTLRFVLSASHIGTIYSNVTCNPEVDSVNAHLIKSVAGDTVLIHFDPAAADTYTVTLTVIAGELSKSASVIVTVLESIAPHSENNPQTLIAGTPDTLIFTLTSKQVAQGVSMQLPDVQKLPATIAKVIKSGTDSLLIAVNSATEGTLSFSIITTNGTFTDTTIYTFTFVNHSNAVWTTPTATAHAVEGQQCSVDLTPYLFAGVPVESIAPTATAGMFKNSVTWQYTPPWGSKTEVSVTITGKRGGTSQNLTLVVTVALGDSAAPEIFLFSPATESKNVGASPVSVSVIVKDAGAGVDSVTFKTAAGTVAGSVEKDSVWSAVISGLAQGKATEVTITATDKSMKKNSSSRKISLTYDPTMADGDAPVFTPVSGPQSGSRVTGATGTIVHTIADGSDVDSVWWTLNGTFIAAIVASDDNRYSIVYTLTKFGENSVKLFAKDGSISGNESSRTITLNYNTAVTAVTPTGPQDGATDVSLTPSFTWTGGTDADGDSVFYRVLYGTSATALAQMTSVLTSKTVTLGSASKLTPTTVYFWQAIAWSKVFPDTGRSEILSFNTLDPTAEDHTGPQIAQTAGPEDGDRVTTATGTITVSVSDPNNVTSVTAKLNAGTALALTAGANNTYAYNYNLTTYGENTVTFTAIDGSANSNPGNESIVLNYNTEPSAIALTTPAANAIGVSISPAFAWSGGDDADGDGVTVTVHYGTAPTNLGSTATVSGKTATATLDYNKTYYWQVTAKSTSVTYPDEVQSSVGSFSTEGSLPIISTDPLSQSVEEGQSVTVSVAAGGFGKLSYQWRENGKTIGTDKTSYTITSVTTDMNNNTYDCIVKNEVGADTSKAATLTVTTIPSFTVSFVTDGGLPKPDNQTVLRGKFATAPSTNPARSGYRFTGWYELNATHDFNFSQTAITADLTIYAGWKKVFTVTYHKNSDESGNVPTGPVVVDSGTTVTVAGNTGNLSKVGHEFKGWTTSQGGSSLVTTITVTSNIDLYPKWEMKAPSITTAITDKNCPVNDAVTFLVVATGVNLSYTWQLNGTTIGTATGSSYTTSNLTVDDVAAARTYKCIVSNSAGSDDCSATLSVSTVNDIDGNVYHQVKIGSQVWLMENLKTTHYRDGAAIPNVTDPADWEALTTPGYCWYDNSNTISDQQKWGALYNWYVVSPANPKMVAIEGWRIPTDTDWTALENYLIAEGYNFDGTTDENKFAKALASKNEWNSDERTGAIGNNPSINNAIGFSALPSGFRNYSGAIVKGTFEGKYYEAYWWSAIENSSSTAYNRYLSYSSSMLMRSEYKQKQFGYSVRLLMD